MTHRTGWPDAATGCRRPAPLDRGVATPDDDHAIQRLLADEDPRALDLLYDRHAGGLYAYAATLVGRDGAEEVIQDLFAAVARQRQAVARAERLAPYLTVMVRHLAGAWIRRRPVGGELLAEPAAPAAPPPAGADEAAQIQAAIARLPVAQREVVVLHTWQGCTFAEIADQLGIATATAGERWQAALGLLRRWLGDHHHD